MTELSTAHPILLFHTKFSLSSRAVPVDLRRGTDCLIWIQMTECPAVTHSMNIRFHLPTSPCLHVLYPRMRSKLNFQLLITAPSNDLKNVWEAVSSSMTPAKLIMFKQFLCSNLVLCYSTTARNTVSQKSLERRTKLFSHFICKNTVCLPSLRTSAA